MARSKLIETYNVETGKQQDFAPDTPAMLAPHSWWDKPETRACMRGAFIDWEAHQGGHSVNRSAGPEDPIRTWATIAPLSAFGPGVEVFVQTDRKCRKSEGKLMTRQVVFGRSPDISNDDWLNQPPPHEHRRVETQLPATLNGRMRASVRLKTGLKGDLTTEMPGDRLVVPMHTSVMDAMVLEPVKARPLETPGRLLFNGSRRSRGHADHITGDVVAPKRTGPFGFTGELWQLGRIAEPPSYSKRGGVAVWVAATPELWVPAWAYTE